MTETGLLLNTNKNSYSVNLI